MKLVKFILLSLLLLLMPLVSYAERINLAEGYGNFYWGQSLASVQEDYKLRNKDVEENGEIKYRTGPLEDEDKDFYGFKIYHYYVYFRNDKLSSFMIQTRFFPDTADNRNTYLNQIINDYREYYQAEPEMKDIQRKDDRVLWVVWEKTDNIPVRCTLQYWIYDGSGMIFLILEKDA